MRIGWIPKSRDAQVASVRFRCLTPIAALQKMGVAAELFEPGQRYDLVVFSKLYGAHDQALAQKLSKAGMRAVLDLSDNHFYNPANLPAYADAARDQRAMIAVAGAVTCCSTALAEVVTAEAAPRRAPIVVGDAVEDFDVIRAPGPSFRMLWFGSHGSPNAPGGMEDVLRLRDTLANAPADSELVIASNSEEKFARIRPHIPCATRYVEWTPETFARELTQAHVVLVPISDNPFTRCKSNNRVATALWHGVPVLADPIPAYEELRPFAVLGDWAHGLELAAAGALEARTQAGRAYVRERFTPEAIARTWRAAFDSILAGA